MISKQLANKVQSKLINFFEAYQFNISLRTISKKNLKIMHSSQLPIVKQKQYNDRMFQDYLQNKVTFSREDFYL